MNRIAKRLAATLFFCLPFFVVRAQHSQGNASPAANQQQADSSNTPAAQLAHHIADKMTDSLHLSNQQRAKVFQINMDMHKEKTSARGKSHDRNIVGRDLQAIEKSRDERYKGVLTTEQYTTYLAKKQNLITRR